MLKEKHKLTFNEDLQEPERRRDPVIVDSLKDVPEDCLREVMRGRR